MDSSRQRGCGQAHTTVTPEGYHRHVYFGSTKPQMLVALHLGKVMHSSYKVLQG